MALIRIDLNRDGIKELLRSREVQEDLLSRAERVATAAGEGFVADSTVGPNRARASVGTTDYASMVAEAEDRALTRAIDAARG